MSGYLGDRDAVLTRLARVEGQVRGIRRMVEDDTYCVDVLTQVSAATHALENIALLLLEDHLSHCVVDAVRHGGPGDPGATAKIREAMTAVTRLVRS